MDINVSCEKSSQVEALSGLDGIERIYSYDPPSEGKERWVQLLPYIMRADTDISLDNEASGVLVRNYDELEYVKESGFDGQIIADAGLYSFNSYSKKRFKSDGVGLDTVPLELNFHEIKERGTEDSELVVYGRVPMMISANCLYLTQNRKCGKNPKHGHNLELIDRKKAQFPIFADCRYCYNIIYNSVPTSLHKDMDKVFMLEPASIRLAFTTEEAEETLRIADYFIKTINGEDTEEFEAAYTKGHFRKGVE